jgi:hypothetical protein
MFFVESCDFEQSFTTFYKWGLDNWNVSSKQKTKDIIGIPRLLTSRPPDPVTLLCFCQVWEARLRSSDFLFSEAATREMSRCADSGPITKCPKIKSFEQKILIQTCATSSLLGVDGFRRSKWWSDFGITQWSTSRQTVSSFTAENISNQRKCFVVWLLSSSAECSCT